MKKLALISRKGGSGKTTLAVHLAICAVLAGKFVVLIDLDPQGSAAAWYEMRGDSKKFVTVKATPEALPDILERAKANGADLAIIDTVPHTDKAALIAANNADFILVPCRTSAFDLKALPATFDLLSLSKTKAAIVLNNAPPVGNLAEETAKHLQNAGYIVSPAVISQRVAFSHAVSDGRAVHEYEPEGKAAVEIAALWDSLKENITNDSDQ